MQGFADAETQTGNDRRPPLTAACDRSLLHSALKRCRQRQVSTAVKQIELDKPQNRRAVARMYGQAREAQKIRQNRGTWVMISKHQRAARILNDVPITLYCELAFMHTREDSSRKKKHSSALYRLHPLLLHCACNLHSEGCKAAVCTAVCINWNSTAKIISFAPRPPHRAFTPFPCCPTFADSSIQF